MEEFNDLMKFIANRKDVSLKKLSMFGITCGTFIIMILGYSYSFLNEISEREILVSFSTFLKFSFFLAISFNFVLFISSFMNLEFKHKYMSYFMNGKEKCNLTGYKFYFVLNIFCSIFSLLTNIFALIFIIVYRFEFIFFITYLLDFFLFIYLNLEMISRFFRLINRTYIERITKNIIINIINIIIMFAIPIISIASIIITFLQKTAECGGHTLKHVILLNSIVFAFFIIGIFIVDISIYFWFDNLEEKIFRDKLKVEEINNILKEEYFSRLEIIRFSKK